MNRRRASEPHIGLQCEGGACCHQGRSTLAQLLEQLYVHPNQITSWRASWRKGSRCVRFRRRLRRGAAGGRREIAACQDRRADAGERFFRGRLTMAGLLSARR